MQDCGGILRALAPGGRDELFGPGGPGPAASPERRPRQYPRTIRHRLCRTGAQRTVDRFLPAVPDARPRLRVRYRQHDRVGARRVAPRLDRNGMVRRKFVLAVNWTSPEIVDYLEKL